MMPMGQAQSVPLESTTFHAYSHVSLVFIQTILATEIIGLAAYSGIQCRLFGDIGATMGILYHLFVGGRFTVFPEYLISAQGWQDGLFHNIVTQIKQCEDNEISHPPMMKQRMRFVNFSVFKMLPSIGGLI